MWFSEQGQNQQGMWPYDTMPWVNPWMPFAGMPCGMYGQTMGQFPSRATHTIQRKVFNL
jgi:hypothetical protein